MATTRKKQRLIAKAKASVRAPRPSRHEPEPSRKPKSYRVIAISLYVPEAEWVDQATKMLQRAGNPKANRSLVVREAILRLKEDLEAKSPEDLLRSFTEREAKRMSL
jgi:hypothetical protein